MTQVSRRYQIALAVIALFAAVWFFALRGHSESSSGSSSPAPAASAKSAAAAPGAPTGVYHGSAPGVEGLTRAISKAHEAVAQSEHNAKQLKRASEAASSSAADHTGTSPATAAATGAAGSHAAASASGSAAGAGTRGRSSAPHSAQAGAAAVSRHQRLVERAIKHGKVAVILFWNPHGGDDRAVQGQLRLLARVHREVRSSVRSSDLARIGRVTGLELGKPIEVFQARAGQVAWFGTFTRAVQIYATPTILIVNHAGKVTTLPGLADAYSIEQAIDEARNS